MTTPTAPRKSTAATPQAEEIASQTPASADAPGETEAPAKHSAVKLPAGVVPKSSHGPQSRNPWQTGGGAGGRPQTDFARRLGKSRKVH